MDEFYIKYSKKLSYILRHSRHIKNNNLKIDSAGWVSINDIQKNCKDFKHIDLNTILYIVKNNNKKRFSIKKEDDIMYIRANQGHTIKSIDRNKLLTKIHDPDLIDGIVHGTYDTFLDSIKKMVYQE